MALHGVGPILKESHNLVATIPKLTFQSLSLTFESQKKNGPHHLKQIIRIEKRHNPGLWRRFGNNGDAIIRPDYGVRLRENMDPII